MRNCQLPRWRVVKRDEQAVCFSMWWHCVTISLTLLVVCYFGVNKVEKIRPEQGDSWEENNRSKTLTFPTTADYFNELYRLQLMRPCHSPVKTGQVRKRSEYLCLRGWCSYSKPKTTISTLSNLRHTPRIATARSLHQGTSPFNKREVGNLWLSM